MTYFDIFNGDADGLCALHQLRLQVPRDSVLITGTKRETQLLARVHPAPGDHLTVLDIGLEQNRDPLRRALEAGASCQYFDHHFAGAPMHHPRLQSHIRTSADVCTSLLVDEFLEGRYPLWATCAAFGDGLTEVALGRCHALALPQDEIRMLRELGEALNYNAYGDSVADLHFDPAKLYRQIQPHADPRDFAATSSAFRQLRQGYSDDMALAQAQPSLLTSRTHCAVALPDAPWSRRINGAFANWLADTATHRAHAVLVRGARAYLVSVRAPRASPSGADVLCRQFSGGGGRSGAGGINALPLTDVPAFLAAFEAAFPTDTPTSPP